MPFLDATAEGILIGVVSIVYGLRWERYYTAWISVVMNVVFTAILLGSTDFPNGFVWIIVAYIALGIVTLYRTMRTIFFLFGTKTFGALALTVALAQSGHLDWTNQIISSMSLSAPDWLGYLGLQYVVSWLAIAGVVHAVGLLFLGRYFAGARRAMMPMVTT